MVRKILAEIIAHFEKIYRFQLGHDDSRKLSEKILRNVLNHKYLRCEEIIYDHRNQILLVLYQFENNHHALTNKALNDALLICDCIIEALWEELNTRKWSEVSLKARLLYGYHRWLEALLKLLKAKEDHKLSTIIEILLNSLGSIDYGLIMSPDLDGQLLAKTGSLLHRVLIAILDRFDFDVCLEWKNFLHKLNVRQTNNSIAPKMRTSCNEIHVIDFPIDLNEFHQNYFSTKTPCIFLNACRNWPCMTDRKWNIPYLMRSISFRLIPIEIGSKYTDLEWQQKILTTKVFVENFFLDHSKGIGYMAQYNLFDQITDLYCDIDVPEFCALGESNYEINCWFGPAGTVSPLHFDDRDNFFVQIIGKKYIRLYSDQTPVEQIYPNPSDSLLWNTSQVDIENLDSTKFSNFNQIDKKYVYEFLLNEGDWLFIPKRCWHFIKAVTDSFSINYWF